MGRRWRGGGGGYAETVDGSSVDGVGHGGGM